MSKTSSIKSIFEDKKKIFSVEFFPPKDEAGGERMLNTASLIQPHKPDFVSITYGMLGGGTRSTTCAMPKSCMKNMVLRSCPTPSLAWGIPG